MCYTVCSNSDLLIFCFDKVNKTKCVRDINCDRRSCSYLF